jgi:hypothetical protein
MRKPRRKISQREARSLRRRCAQLENLANIHTATPGPRWEICHFTMSDAMLREISVAFRFGASLRAERTGNLIEIFAYRRPEVK